MFYPSTAGESKSRFWVGEAEMPLLCFNRSSFGKTTNYGRLRVNFYPSRKPVSLAL